MSVLVISVCALTTFVSAANNWPQGTNDFRNLLLQGSRPVRQSGPFSQTPVAYNNANGFANVPYNPQQNQLPNLPVNNIQWLPFLPPNNAYPFLQPPVKNQNPDFQRALNNFVNVQTNNLQKKPYSQGGYIQTPGTIVEQKPSPSNQGFPINQVQYIAYTTPQSVNQLNRNTGNPQQPIQVASFNMKQAYPQNNPNVIPQFIDLDFNAKNPFNGNPNNKLEKQNQYPRGSNVPVQPVINFDINFNTPFPQNHPVAPNPNQQYTQTPHSILTPPKPSTKVVPHLPSLSGIEFDSNNPFVAKNHKDDITHEPVHQPPDTFYDTEETPPVERLEHEKAPETVHDEPPEVPTRPIYPGQGKWAKFGLRKKHKPHISPHPNNYAILPETLGIPEGYDTFLEGQDLFDFQNNQFGKKLQEFPNKHQVGPALPEDEESTPEYEQQQYQSNDDGGSQENEDEFTPSRLYAQVRHTEDEKHLPPAADENGKLKELLKDSKVHTIYSEEGFEDLAYDHAGHEKKAENAEGYEKDKKEVVNDKAKTNIPIKEVKDIQKEKETYVDKEKINKDEFENLKEEALRFDDEEEEEDDSETEATEYDKSIITKVRPPKKVYSAKTKDASKYKVKVNDDVEGRGSSPISTIVKGDGNTEIEISSEVKVIVQPNNTTKSHKYVKIYPKFRKTLRTDGESGDGPIEVEINKNVKIMESTATDSPLTTNTPSIEEVFTVEMPATTQATTAIPKTRQERIIRRRKRDAETIPQIEVDTDFIDKINHTLPPSPDKEAILRAKFPYYLDYKQIGLNENSALRYSEDLKKAPPKTKSKFAFYKQADQKRECSEVDPIVDPVPDRIKKQDEDPEAEEETDTAEQPKTPRLGTLGDKIDCFKAKYFGENPFDNPLFEEKSVGSIEPIFEQIDKMSKKQSVAPVKREALEEKRKTKKVKGDVGDKKETTLDKNDSEEWETQTDRDDDSKEDKIIESKLSKDVDNIDETESKNDPKKDTENIDITKNEIDSDVKTTSTPTLITTPKYTIDLKPKHIYDQIELLEHLPADEETSSEKSSTQKSDDISNQKRKLSKAKSRIKEKKYNFEKIKLKDTEKTGATKPQKSKQKSNDENSIFERYSLFDEDEVQTAAPKSNESGEIENLEKLSEKGTETTLTLAPKTATAKIEIARKINRLKKKIKSKLDAAPSKAKIKSIQKRRGRTFISTKSQENQKDLENIRAAIETIPEAEPLRRRRRLRKRSRFPFIFDINPYLPHVPVISPPFVDDILTPRPASYVELSENADGSYEIFDISPYLSSTTEESGSESRVSPKYKRLSEGFYKDDIKPDEQLNVFNDVINNIKNSPYQQDMYNSASEQVTFQVKPDDFKAKYKVKSTTNTPLKNRRIKNHQQSPDKKGFVRPNMQHRLRQRSTTTTTEPEWANYENHKNVETETQGQEDIPDKKGFVRPNMQHRLRQRSTTTTTEPEWANYENHKNMETETQGKEDMKPVYERNQDTNKKETVTIESLPSEYVLEGNDQENSTEVIGLLPPKSHKYKTIYNPKRDINKEISSEETVEQKKLNRYLVPGMRPPPNRKVHSYSEYLTANHIRQKPVNRKRNRRSAARPSYAEVSRDKSGPQAEEKNETKIDDDDYEPHRPRNYHYDEESGRIIYDKKPEEIHEESEEVEYIEVIEETPPSTTSKPKQNPIFATATPPPEGESYIDFVKLLKSSSGYKEIPDPVSTEKGEEASTTEASSTAKPVSTTPPEFLSILAKVRNDSNYKTIEDKKKETTTTATTTEEDSIDDAEDVESQVKPVQNSPGSMGIVNGQMFKLFDITDFLPKPKNYLPKTIVDTSKYKSIQRPTARHNLSSRYNSEEEKDLSNINTSKKPLLAADEKTGETKETPVEKVISPTLKNIRRGTPFTTTTTTVKPAQGSPTPRLNRGIRRRVTTVKTTTITQADPSSPELTRNRRTHRRRNLRVRPVTTTATTTTEGQAARTGDPLKVLHRRPQRDSTTLSSENKEQILPESRVNYRQARNQNEATTKPSEENNDNTVQVAQKVAHIFRNYNRLRRRGGPKEVDGVASENRLGQSQRNRIPQTGDVDVFKSYDKTKKHGGNYRAENEGNVPVKESVEVLKDYDKDHKHGGNYKEESESGETKQAIVDENDTEKANDVETFKDYDKEKKHGGNYRSEDEAQHLTDPQYEESRVLTPKGNQIETKVKDVEAFKNYDKTKKHGGNYVSEEEAKRIAAAKAKEQDIEIFNNYDKTKKHGGNYKSEEDSVLDPEIEESSYDNLDVDQKLKKRNHENGDPEIIFKPEMFYADPKLPVVINGLKIVDDLSHEELEKIVSDPESGSAEESSEGDIERKDRQNVIGREDKERTTKKPLFIKDPSQRLYFYAPV